MSCGSLWPNVHICWLPSDVRSDHHLCQTDWSFVRVQMWLGVPYAGHSSGSNSGGFWSKWMGVSLQKTESHIWRSQYLSNYSNTCGARSPCLLQDMHNKLCTGMLYWEWFHSAGSDMPIWPDWDANSWAWSRLIMAHFYQDRSTSQTCMIMTKKILRACCTLSRCTVKKQKGGSDVSNHTSYTSAILIFFFFFYLSRALSTLRVQNELVTMTVCVYVTKFISTWTSIQTHWPA